MRGDGRRFGADSPASFARCKTAASHEVSVLMKTRTLTTIILAALVTMSGFTQAETKEEFDQRMAWFREARFGMFIHWGLYAVPAGEWKGKKVKGLAEWIQSEAQDPGGRIHAAQGPVQPGEIRCRRLGAPRQGRGHEIHRHHQQASRRLLPLGFQANRLGHRLHALQEGPAQAAGRGLRETRREALFLSFHHGLAPPGLGHQKTLARQCGQPRAGHGQVHRLPEGPAQRIAHRLRRHRHPLVRRRMGGRLDARTRQGPLRMAARRSIPSSSSTTAWTRAARAWRE